jgi:hypothetical protein
MFGYFDWNMSKHSWVVNISCQIQKRPQTLEKGPQK